jgi:WASH complex subunit 7
VFTEDGFALGLAFCLEVLGQWRPLDALHWSESVSAYLAAERTKVIGPSTAAAGPTATQALTLRRIEATVREFQLLDFSLSPSRIFFQVKKRNSGLDDKYVHIVKGTVS